MAKDDELEPPSNSYAHQQQPPRRTMDNDYTHITLAGAEELGIRNFTQAAGSGDAYLAAYANISQTTNAYRSARSSAARAAAMTTAKVVVDESGNVTPTA